MEREVESVVAEYLSDDPARWAKLAGTIHWRRLQLLLLRAILLELRKISAARESVPRASS
jgi:hypothetical protein